VFDGGDVPATLSLKCGSWAAAWAAAGIATDADARGATATLPVGLRFNGYRYAADVTVTYSAKAGSGARFRY
jgi:hypothetical protein